MTEFLRILRLGAESLFAAAESTSLFPPPLSRRAPREPVERPPRESENVWANVGGYFNATTGYLTNAIEKQRTTSDERR